MIAKEKECLNHLIIMKETMTRRKQIELEFKVFFECTDDWKPYEPKEVAKETAFGKIEVSIKDDLVKLIVTSDNKTIQLSKKVVKEDLFDPMSYFNALIKLSVIPNLDNYLKVVKGYRFTET